MMPCSTCGDPLRSDRERLGARCPNCREPLYEPARDPHHAQSDRGEIAGSKCAAHGKNAAVGTCQRCGNYLCSVCWTRWHDQSLCSACLNRALDSQENTPVQVRAHLRQAILSIIFGILAWLVTLGSMLIMAIGLASGSDAIQMQLLVVLGMLVFMGSPLPAILGVGQAAAAIRARGDHMILATIGLLLSGLHTGMLIGMFTVAALESFH
jgi:hypothetical protein